MFTDPERALRKLSFDLLTWGILELRHRSSYIWWRVPISAEPCQRLGVAAVVVGQDDATHPLLHGLQVGSLYCRESGVPHRTCVPQHRSESLAVQLGQVVLTCSLHNKTLIVIWIPEICHGLRHLAVRFELMNLTTLAVLPWGDFVVAGVHLGNWRYLILSRVWDEF